MSKLIRKSNKGFTLIELMIVVAIIGILAAIAIPNFLRFQLKAKSSEGKVNIAAIRTAEESYLAEFGVYVLATASPGAIPGSSKDIFVDMGVLGTNFNTLGWAPEGQVFFQYAVAYLIATPGAYTITAQADIDGDTVVQSWGYVKADNLGVSLPGPGCLATGVWDAAAVPPAPTALTTVGPCDGTSGQSLF